MNTVSRSSRYRRRLVAAAAVVTLLSVLAMLLRVPLGERKHWRQNYTAERHWPGVAPAALVLVLVALAGASVLPRSMGWPRWRRAGVAAGLTVLIAVGYVLNAQAGKFGVVELVAAFMLPSGSGSYYCEAERIGPYPDPLQKRLRRLPVFASVRDYLDQYAQYEPEEVFPSDTLRVVTHPPGPSLLCYGVQRPLRTCPGLADRLIGLYRRLFPSDWGRHTFILSTPVSARIFLAGITTCGLATIALASLLAPVVLWAASRLGLRGWAGPAFALCAMLPSLHLYSPGIDQTFPLWAMLFWTVLLVACQRNHAALAACAGALFFVCMGFSLAFVVALAIPLAGAGLWWTRTERRGPALRRAARIACPLVGGFALILVIAQLTVGYDAIGAWLRCYRHNKLFNAESARGYWPWLLYNPVMFVLFLGGPTAVLWLAGTAAALRRWWRKGRVVGRDWLPLGVAGVIVLLWFSGLNRGEVERLWMFLMPACLLAGLCGLRTRPRAGESLALLLMQAAQVAVFRVCYDAWDFARYFSHDFLQQGQ